jgi:hypothetical protein
MTRDEELWGMAIMVLQRHGDQAALYVAERIGKLALHGEAEGVALWREVAHRLNMLTAGAHSA